MTNQFVPYARKSPYPICRIRILHNLLCSDQVCQFQFWHAVLDKAGWSISQEDRYISAVRAPITFCWHGIVSDVSVYKHDKCFLSFLVLIMQVDSSFKFNLFHNYCSWCLVIKHICDWSTSSLLSYNRLINFVAQILVLPHKNIAP